MNIKRRLRQHFDNYQSVSYKNIIKELSKYEYVSFDIFDTLVKRDVEKPTDLFKIIEKNECITDFFYNRVNAEQRARCEIKKRDVSLDEIYSYYDGISDDERLYYKNKEIAYEKNICNCNQLIYPIYKWCLENNKKIIILSDMYLDKNTIRSILYDCGYAGRYILWISNEHNICKQDGSMYQKVLQKMNINARQVIHIGNSFIADYYKAKKNGVDAIKIETNNSRAIQDYKKTIKGNNFGYKCLQSFINNHTKSWDYYYKFGFEAFGPALYGFCRWVYQQLIELNCDTALFLGRDGFIMKQVYDELGFDELIPSKYIEVSRRSFRIPYLEESLTYEKLFDVIPMRKYTSIKEFLEAVGLDVNEHIYEVEKCHLSIDQGFDINEIKIDKNVEKLYEELKSTILKNSLDEKACLYQYLDENITGKNIGIIDVGWGGTIQHYIEKYLTDIQSESIITGLYWGVSKRAKTLLGSNSKAKGYFYDCFSGNNTYDMQKPFDGFFETLFLQQVGSVKRYRISESGSMEIQRMPIEYESIVTERIKNIQEGALLFAQTFSKSVLADCVDYNDKIMMYNLLRIATNPTLEECDRFGDIVFYDSGNKMHLIEKMNLNQIIRNPKNFFVGYFNSYWKIGYLKKTLKISLPYMKIYTKYLPMIWNFIKRRNS